MATTPKSHSSIITKIMFHTNKTQVSMVHDRNFLLHPCNLNSSPAFSKKIEGGKYILYEILIEQKPYSTFGIYKLKYVVAYKRKSR